MTYQLYLGDCLDFMRTLPASSVDAVVTDPPYGINMDTDYTRFVGGLTQNRNHGGKIEGDDKPFDPSPFLGFKRVIMFGMNHYSNMLPSGGVFVWLKKRDSQIGSFLSDCELAWISGIQGCYAFRHVWHGFDRQTERGEVVIHPTQKPVAVMRYLVENYTCAGDTIFDPFMGSGTTGVACMQLGRNFIGCEIDPGYYAIAEKRISEAAMQQPLFTDTETEPKPEQAALL